MTMHGLDRRTFLGVLGSGAAQLCVAVGAGVGTVRPLLARTRSKEAVIVEPWGRIERLADGAWAMISTPLAGGAEAFRTVSNGGIIAGDREVAVIEGLATEQGARWLSESAFRLTGRWPSHVILTHYHADHSNGLAGHRRGGDTPIFYSTVQTLTDAESSHRERGRPQASAIQTLEGEHVALIQNDQVKTIDLGGRRLRIVPRAGHTRSDLVVTMDDPRLVWSGDLVWNGMFPNCMDAIPSVLFHHVRAVLEQPARQWVPGHGDLADKGDLEIYLALLASVEAAARRAIEAGTPIDVAAKEYRPPRESRDWVLFSPDYHEVAFRAWERELAPNAAAALR